MNTPKLLPLLSLLAVILVPGPAQAHSPRLAEVTIVNRDTGERLPTYHHRGQLYVAGTPGQRYAVELRNRDGGRVLSVLSVDGVNVLTGETAAPRQSGYVLSPWQRYEVTGWRKSLDEVAQFVFTALPDSYAARTDRPEHVGVIGVALFREKRVPSPVLQAPAAPAAGASAPARESMADSLVQESRAEAESSKHKALAERLGTGHGERETSPTRWTDFERAGDRPDELVTIYYDSRANLIARGIIRTPSVPRPDPFPAAGFVPDPRG
jgi:hypothetical protein